MEDYEVFQTQFTSIMATVLQTAVREATQLFEGTLQHLKAELVILRRENVKLKKGDSSSQVKTRCTGFGNQRNDNASKNRDVGVQCEKAVFVDRGCNTLQFIGQRLHVGDITSDKLAELCTNEDENRQLALLLIKQEPQETEHDHYKPGYFLLKQEGAEPILVRREPNNDTMERVVIPTTFQTISRHYGNSGGNSLVTRSSCSHRVNPCGHQSNQSTCPARGTAERTSENRDGLSSQNEKERESAFAPVETSTTSVEHANSTQNLVSSVELSVPMIELSCAPGCTPITQVHRRPNQNHETINKTISPQSIMPLAQEVTPLVQAFMPLNHVPDTSASNTISPVQDPILSTSLGVSQTQVFASSPKIMPVHSASSSPLLQFPLVPQHNPSHAAEPSYLPTHVPFSYSHNPVTPIQGSVPSLPALSTGTPTPPQLLQSQYSAQSDQFTSLDHFFPPPDNTTCLLESLDTLPLHSPILMTPQDALEQSSMPHLQPSGPLAPLLTLKEQRAATSTHSSVLGRVPIIPLETAVSPVNHFEVYTGETKSVATDDDEDLPEYSEYNSPTLQSRLRKQRKAFSKSRQISLADEVSTFTFEDMGINGVQNDLFNEAAHCGTSFSTNYGSQALTKASSKTLQRSTECAECGRVLSNASALENHMRLHTGERPYTCSQCGKAFPSARGLNRHVKVHTEEKRYQCEECGKSFVYHFTLTKHKLIHSGERPFPCKVCGKRFLAKADRSTHMRMHTGEKPFSCTQCGKKFKHRVALNMHMQGHRGEKRYICPHCEKGFVDLGNFKRHKLIHTGERPFECKECGKRFTQSAHLKKHVNTQHVLHEAKLTV
ncbi:uncharacterized protein LOC127651829 [Xyrauchen texanus]|uniref:uncharacterized protein LOC127651829 n=1 Tax=Xyrauchen texanus TaxID=154827 RepID=UPI0022428817|nr:uncharacterized protein LOC127651829 [Xyrauchen texanus]